MKRYMGLLEAINSILKLFNMCVTPSRVTDTPYSMEYTFILMKYKRLS